MNNNDNILVSCVCITYNHKEFIRKCLDGMLMQETSFPYEIIIYDDCSTDGTREIVKEYANTYPNKIRTVLPDENQYSKIGDIVREVYVHPLVRGKYIALCEGDDRWTHPRKLQMQVDFMESHSDYSICFHEFSTFNVLTGEICKTSRYSKNGDFDITVNDFLLGCENIAQPLTMMYRMSSWNSQWFQHYKTLYLDTVEIFHFLRAGKGRFLRFVGGEYNMHEGGVSSQMSDIVRAHRIIPTYVKMFHYTKDDVLIQKIKESSLWALSLSDSFFDKIHIIEFLIKNVPSIAVMVCGTYFKRKIFHWLKLRQ